MRWGGTHLTGRENVAPPIPNGEVWRELKRIADEVDHLQKDMWHGNGRPGVTTRLNLLEGAVDGVDLSKLENRVTQMEKTIQEFKNGQSWIIRLLIGGVILAALNLVIHH